MPINVGDIRHIIFRDEDVAPTMKNQLNPVILNAVKNPVLCEQTSGCFAMLSLTVKYGMAI